jgi:dihydroneopterin triphosphate diphosphatase
VDIRQEIPIKSFSVAAYVCRVENDVCKHLIIRRKPGYLGGTWQMISGRIEPGEKGWQAALREIKEETRLVPDRFYSANSLEAFYEVNKNCINLIPVFVAFIDTDQPVHISHEHSEYKWITAAEAEDYVAFSHQQEMLRTIESLFVKSTPNPFLEIKFE